MFEARYESSPEPNHRDFYTKTATTLTNLAVSATEITITQSAVGTTSFFAMECYNSINWVFSPYFQIEVVEDPCLTTTISPITPLYGIKLWIDLYVDWDSNPTPQPVTEFKIDVETRAVNSNPTECPTHNFTLTSVKQLLAVVDPSVYSSVLTYSVDTKELVIANYEAVEVNKFTGLQIFFQGAQELKLFDQQYFDLSIDYNLCLNSTLTYTKPPFEIVVEYYSEQDFFGKMTHATNTSITPVAYSFSSGFATQNASCPIVDYALAKVEFKNGTEFT